jgi:anoctamin-10
MVNNYFGSRIAFLFAWNGFYCKALLALVPPALLFEGANLVAYCVGKSDWWNRGSVCGMSIVVAIWAKLACNWWAADQEFLVSLWDLSSQEEDRTIRADFHGELEVSDVDGNKKDLHDPAWKHKLRIAVAWFATAALSCCVFLTTLVMMNMYSGHLDLWASIAQAVIMFVYQLINDCMCDTLTVWENHKHNDTFYTSYLSKMFIFNAVNSYFSFFYTSFVQQYTSVGCNGHDCLGMLQNSLPTTLLVLAILQVVQTVLATYTVKFSLWYESRGIVNEGGKPPVYSYVEVQSKYSDYRFREQIGCMSQLCISLGYVLIFGPVAPRIIPICLAVFAIQLRAQAKLLCTSANRTVPRVSVGIGAWQSVIDGLLVTGIVYSGYLLVQFGPAFRGCEILTKLSFLCIYVVFLLASRIFIDFLSPSTSDDVKVLIGRRQYVKKALWHKSETVKMQLSALGGSSPRKKNVDDEDTKVPDGVHVEHVEAQHWHKIPQALKEETSKEG